LAVFAVKVASFYFILNLNIIMKGIESKTIFLIIAVIIAVLSLIILFPAASQLILKGWGLEQILGTQLTAEEKAILCAYYRCKEGCVNPATQKYCEDFFKEACSDPEVYGFSENNKVCGTDALQFPVEIVAKDEKISKSHLQDLAQCIVTDKSEGGVNWQDIAQRATPIWSIIKGMGDLWGEVKILFIKENLLSDKKTETCEISAIKIDKALGDATVSGNTYIATIDNSVCYLGGLLGCKSVFLTEVQDSPQYIALKKGESSEVLEIKSTYYPPFSETIKIRGYRIFLSDTQKNYGLHFFLDTTDNTLNVLLLTKGGKTNKKFADGQTGNVELSEVKVEITSNSITPRWDPNTGNLLSIDIETKFKITYS